MAAFEPYVIEVIMQFAKMRVPINDTNGLHLANSMMEGATIARDLARKRKFLMLQGHQRILPR
jgi:hypothetical protein